tara:strand:- start:841 stop:1560 length:720 start_codon:yes stop_codon:yes gene_type:complete
MASDLALFQVASITALVGMGLGWRGVMTRYSGFYDLPTAWSMMFWGILIGGIYGTMGDRSLLIPYLTGEFLPYYNVVICLLMAVVVHLVLRTKKVRRTGSQPTTGWALGLAVGGMVAMFVIFRLLESYSFDIQIAASMILVALISPRGHALIFCRHGHGMLMDKRWSIVLRTFFWSTLLLTSLYTALKNPVVWIFIIPPLLLAEKQAQNWVWAAVPKPARRRLRRIWADASRNNLKEDE